MNVYSLADVHITIMNDSTGEQIALGGGGENLGSVGYSYDRNIFNMNVTPDGGATVSVNKSKAGTIELSFTQGCPYIAELTRYFNWCRENYTKAAATITGADSVGNINFNAINCFPVKIPNNTMGETPTERTFEFKATQIDSLEALVQEVGDDKDK